MKNSIKLGLGVLTVLVAPLAINAVDGQEAQATTGWVQRGNVWYHYSDNGVQTKNAWVGNYWLGADGRMATNSWVDNDKYYVGKDGAWEKDAKKPGWDKIGNTWYYYNAQGKMVRNAWAGSYWLGADGRMATNAWVDNDKYYVGKDGAWEKDAKKPGWDKIGNTWYYYDAQGKMVKNAWAGNYWLGADGRMVTNSWVDNDKYYVGKDGAWLKNVKIPEGNKATWVKAGDIWYYYNEQGEIVKNAWAGNYWLGADGRMATNAWVDNNKYYVGSNGAWEKDAKKPGWDKTENTWHYYNAQGKMMRNAWVGNYWLGADGRMATNAWVDSGRYYVGADGAWVPAASSNTPALKMPQYYQGDSRWGNKYYGISTMRNTGCVPTSLAMIFSGLGKSVTPTQVADVIYHNTNEFNKRELGTSGAGADYAVRYYGFNNSIIQSKEQLVDALKKGYPVFAAMANGYFVRGNSYTHAVVLSGYQNGKTKAMDPDNAYTTQKWYDVDQIWNQRSLEPSDTIMGGSFMSIGKK